MRHRLAIHVRSLRRFKVFVSFCCVAFCGTIFIVGKSYLASETARIEESGLDAAKRDTGYARERMSGTLARISALAQNAMLVNHSYQNKSANFAAELEGLRRQVAIAGPEVRQALATSATGDVVWSTLPLPRETVNATDRDYFQKLAAGEADAIIGGPFVGKMSGKPSIQFAYALRDSFDKFQGMIVVTIDAMITKRWQQSIPDNHRTVVTLLRSDGRILSRSQELDEPTPMLVGEGVPETIHKVITEGSASFRHISWVDGIPRFVAASHVPDWNTVLLVGLETQLEDAQISQIRLNVILLGLLAAFSGIALAVASISVWRRWQTTARMKALGQDLSRRESVLLQIAENTTDFIMLLDGEFRYLYGNAACQHTFGIDKEKWIGQRLGYSLDSSQDLNIALATLARDGNSQRLLMDIPDAAGTFHWVELEITAVDIRSEDFVSPCRYFAVGRDVTERMVNKQQLAVSQHRIENILRIGPGFFYEFRLAADGSVSVDLPIEPGNKLLGYSVQEATGPLGLLTPQTHHNDRVTRKLAVQRCIAEGQASVEYRAIAKDGSTHWMSCQMRLSRNDDSGTEIISFLTDITSEYTMRNRLRHSEQLATLGQLSASIAHEMNQPLAAMSLAAENTMRMFDLDHAPPERIRGKLEQICAHVERLSQIIERIRQFSRNEQGSVSVFALPVAIEEALTLAQSKIKEAGVTVERRLAADLPALRTERLLLEQVLMNLIVNACDAYRGRKNSGVGTQRPLTISAEASETGLAISVADRAGGFAPEAMSRMFEPFFTTKPADLGTGLGLSICAANLADLGADISAHNEDGGAVILIRIPTSLFAKPPPARPVVAAAAPSA